MCPGLVIVKTAKLLAVTIPAVPHVKPLQSRVRLLQIRLGRRIPITKLPQDLDADNGIPVMVIGPRVLQGRHGAAMDPTGNLISLCLRQRIPEHIPRKMHRYQICGDLGDALIGKVYPRVGCDVPIKAAGRILGRSLRNDTCDIVANVHVPAEGVNFKILVRKEGRNAP